MQVDFVLLGSGAGPGLPSFFCECAGCLEARNQPELTRTRSGAFIDTEENKVLIDASPDLRQQLIRENISQVDYVFLTHWHYDHFGGLGELEYYVKLARREPISLLLPPSAIEQFLAAFPNLTEVFEFKAWEFNKPYYFKNFSITALPAQHGIETAGFLIETSKKSNNTLAYFPDTAGLTEASAAKVSGVDYLVCDATFHGENWYPETHMSIHEAIELGKKIGAKNTVLTHLAIHYSQPITTRQLTEELAAFKNVSAAYDGMRIKI